MKNLNIRFFYICRTENEKNVFSISRKYFDFFPRNNRLKYFKIEKIDRKFTDS